MDNGNDAGGYPFFAVLSRMKYINRWGLMRNNRNENIQEHSLQVAIISHALALMRNRYFGGEVDADRAAVIALFHDCDEILTGDMPTPVKYFNEGILNAYREVGDVAKERLLSMLPEELRADYRELIYKGNATPGAARHPLRPEGGNATPGAARHPLRPEGGDATPGAARSSLRNELSDATPGAARHPLRDEGGNLVWDLVKAADTICAYIKCLEEIAGGNTEFAAAAKATRQKLDAIELPEVRMFIRDYIDAFSLSLDEFGI